MELFMALVYGCAYAAAVLIIYVIILGFFK